MITSKLRTRLGLVAFVVASLIALVRVALERRSEHYFLFTQAADLLWAGENPYGRELGTPIGLWFYSPACGMFFFKLFSWIQPKLGELLNQFFPAIFVSAHHVQR